MVLLRIRGQFSRAARASAPLQDGPVMRMSEDIFHQIFEPILQIMINTPIHSDNDIGINLQIKEFRQICNEAQMFHNTDDYILKLGRGELLNTLENILENTKKSNGGLVVMEGKDLLALSSLTDVIRGNAKTYKEFMKLPLIATALDDVADNIDAAQSRLWRSGINKGYIHIPSIKDRSEGGRDKYLH